MVKHPGFLLLCLISKLINRLTIHKNLASVLLWALLYSASIFVTLLVDIVCFVFSVFQFSCLVSQKVNLKHSF